MLCKCLGSLSIGEESLLNLGSVVGRMLGLHLGTLFKIELLIIEVVYIDLL